MSETSMLCCAPMHNTKGRRDATGAFIPEAKRFLRYHSQHEDMLVLIDNSRSKATMRAQVEKAVEYCGHGELVGVHFFCHGWRKGIQFGYTLTNTEKLCRAIRAASSSSPVVTFYSCDVGRDADRDRQDDLRTMGGDGGFADEFRDELCRHGADCCRVDGHTTTGHTTRNPHVRRFLGDGSPCGGSGGFYIVPRQKKELFKLWRSALRTDFRFRFPYMTQAEIMAYLRCQ